MFKKHKTSFALFVGAVLCYLILGLLLPELSYSPKMPSESGWNAVQAVKGLLQASAPFMALFIFALAVIAYFRESR